MFMLNLSVICSCKKNMDYYYYCIVSVLADKPLPGARQCRDADPGQLKHYVFNSVAHSNKIQIEDAF